MHGVTAGVDDGLRWHARGLQVGCEELDVGLLVLSLVVLRVGAGGEFAGCEVPGVPTGDVGGDTTEGLGLAGGDVGVCEDLGTGL